MQRIQYVLTIQYLGFRYHGYQKQTNAKTIQEMLDRSLNYILNDINFKTFGSSRTDSMVSANKMTILLTTWEKINHENVLIELNKSLPSDIKALSLQYHPKKINIIGDVEEKTYHYYFCHGEKMNPMAAPYITNILDELDIDKMISGTKLFKGERNFKHFTFKGGENKEYKRTLKSIELVENDILTASFFPEKSYVLKICGKGFLRQQIRLIAGALFNLGQGKITEEQIILSLKDNYEGDKINFIAPASGLILYDLKINL